ncbi:hypothetical protein AMTRI_Chr05g56790 [Amborella trichopoda]|uniref:ATP-dependent DNA helicase DDX11 n=1 Tax=Amborella trichopoda TaxID=13333 RepID=UPI0005D361DA|nr:ATP-dependent DNA helicase DDX11 [Amborella trichopoda]|eukprot:XP_011620586.1 ATP-dependent DNA helicase DDX11 [Amborella trichopoda]
MEMQEETPKFPAFPFKPYSIQLQFMTALYNALDSGGVAMLESPTGTGKTLSIICSALQWVVDQRSKEKKPNTAIDQGSHNFDDEPDWMKNFVVPKGEKSPQKKSSTFGYKSVDSRERRTQRNPIESNNNICGRKGGLIKMGSNSTIGEMDEDEEFLVNEYKSETDENGDKNTKRKAAGSSSDEEVDDDEEEETEGDGVFKVYFSSRTHSQLSQFVKEMQRTVFASTLRVICLGSRKSLCTNAEVSKLGSLGRINERCMELQRRKTTKESRSKISNNGVKIQRSKLSSGCPMMKHKKFQRQLRNEISQSDAMDIEDLLRLGQKIGTCPYYGSRSMVRTADLVVLPYQSLLLKSARESLGLTLKNSVVIIDEAHNLADALINMYNSKVTKFQLEQVEYHLTMYFERFRNRLGTGNRRYIQILMVVAKALLQLLICKEEVNSVEHCKVIDAQQTEEPEMCNSSVTVNDFLFSLEIDNVNLIKLKEYVKESNITHKVSGYGAKLNILANGSPQSSAIDDRSVGVEGSIVSAFQAFVDFMFALTNDDTDGRIIVSKKEGSLKFVMLAGEKIFSEIVDQAHAVVLAGGTLQPTEETVDRLFPCLPMERLHLFSCNHIVPPESILPIAVSCGPTGKKFDFSYHYRSSPGTMEELGYLICNLVTVVPEGIVVFFSSFEYEKQVHESWKASGIMARIQKRKRVFREPRNSVEVESVLKEYQEAILVSIDNSAQSHGALLLAVVGGKVSEGINFSDGMGRCVVMVGLPYPSPSNIELIERIKHIEGLGKPKSQCVGNHIYCETPSEAGFQILKCCKNRGREYYENLCMKAVNQSIGRVIRHVNDYAAILLVDSRYSSLPSKRSFADPSSKLPLWIKDRLVSTTANFGEVHRLLYQFFKINKGRKI